MITFDTTKGYVATIDDIDADITTRRWSASTNGAGKHYVKGTLNNKTVFLHRVIASRVLGRELLKGEVVDHKDGDPMNNCRNNIRVCTQAENNRNNAQRRHKAVDYKGVHMNGSGFTAAVKLGGKYVFRKTFKTATEAAKAYDHAARKHHGEFAKTNFEVV